MDAASPSSDPPAGQSLQRSTGSAEIVGQSRPGIVTAGHRLGCADPGPEPAIWGQLPRANQLPARPEVETGVEVATSRPVGMNRGDGEVESIAVRHLNDVRATGRRMAHENPDARVELDDLELVVPCVMLNSTANTPR